MELLKDDACSTLDLSTLDRANTAIIAEFRSTKRRIIWWMIPVYLLFAIVIIVLSCHVVSSRSGSQGVVESKPVESKPATSPEVTLPANVKDIGSELTPGECFVSAGGPGGGVFSHYVAYQMYGRITAIDFKITARQLTGMRARYGEQFTSWVGDYNEPYTRVSMATGEIITSVVLYGGIWNGLDVVEGLALYTNHSRHLGPYGKVTRSEVNGTGEEVLYFSGNAGHAIDGLNVHARGCDENFDLGPTR